jgi:hypothetical protein
MASTSPRARAKRGSRAAADRRARAEQILALFTWHRDAPLVARSLRLSLDELHAELDALKLRRKAYRLVRGSEFDFPIVKAVPGAPSGPPVRRRARAAAPPAPTTEEPSGIAEREPAHAARGAAAAAHAEAAADGVAAQAIALLALLGEVGPRRAALATKLGRPGRPLPERVLLARFRAAGLEREFGHRERDLLRALFARHRGAARDVAAELGMEPDALERLVRERGLSRQLEALRERFRREGPRRSTPARR